MFKRLLRRIVFASVYHVYAKRRMATSHLVQVAGFSLLIPPGVFDPSLFFTSAYFSGCIKRMDFSGASVLDLGCGSGVLSLAAASVGAQVTALDISEVAVEATLENARRNGLLASVRAMQSEMFSALKEGELMFDRIIVNPPYYKKRALTPAERSWNAGEGLEFFTSLASGLREHLRRTGQLLMVLSSDAEVETILSILGSAGIRFKEVNSKPVLFEKLFIYAGTFND